MKAIQRLQQNNLDKDVVDTQRKDKSLNIELSVISKHPTVSSLRIRYCLRHYCAVSKWTRNLDQFSFSLVCHTFQP